MFSCSHSSPIYNPQTMSKRQMQEEKRGEEERVVAKSKPMMSSVSKTANRSPTALGSSASDRTGTLGAHSSNSDRTGTWRAVARGVNETTASSSQVWHSDANRTIGAKVSHHNFQICNHLENVYSCVRQKSSRPQGDEMLDIDVNATIWGISMSATIRAAVHFGQDYQENSRTITHNGLTKWSRHCSIFRRNGS